MAVFDVQNLHFSYGINEVLKGLSFSMEEGEFVCVLGRNGCGKTTLLQTMLGLLRPQRGSIKLYGDDIHKLNERAMALKVAYIPQGHIPPFPFRVLNVVLMGRTPHMSRTYHSTPEDLEIAMNTLDTMGIADYKDRIYTELSGGQRQMVIIARAVAQQSKVLIMDEPTANLDFSNQYLVLSQMLRLSRRKISILMVTHNPDHAIYCADHVIAIDDGRVVSDGRVEEVISEPVLRRIYDMDVCVRNIDIAADLNSTVCVPVPRTGKFFQAGQGLKFDHKAL